MRKWMVNSLNGFTEGVIGKRLPSEKTLNSMKKSELIELLNLAQLNYESLLEKYNNAVNFNVKFLKKK